MRPGRALSDDLRERVVAAYLQRGPETTLAMIASRFQVSLSSVKRLVHNELEGVERPQRGHRPRTLTLDNEYTLSCIYTLHPDLYLDEARDQLAYYTGKRVHKSTIWRTLEREGITHKKLETRHCAPAGLEVFELMQRHIPGEACVWVDEVGLSMRNRFRRYGWSPRGIFAQMINSSDGY